MKGDFVELYSAKFRGKSVEVEKPGVSPWTCSVLGIDWPAKQKCQSAGDGWEGAAPSHVDPSRDNQAHLWERGRAGGGPNWRGEFFKKLTFSGLGVRRNLSGSRTQTGTGFTLLALKPPLLGFCAHSEG